MTSTGIAAFSPAFTYIATSAYRKLGVINEDEDPTAGMYEDALFAINALTKEWMASGIHVWTEEEAVLFLQPGQAKYLLGGTTTANTADSDSWQLLSIGTSAISGATTITLDDAANVILGQYIGIVLDDNTTQWTTVKHTPVGNAVIITTALTDSASAENNVIVYTTKILRPLKIPACRLLIYNGLLETPMNEFSRAEYMDLPNKSAAGGTPTAFFYTPSINQGQLFVWPVPVNSNNAVRFTWYRPLFDFTNPEDTSDTPQEWINALTWNLALELAPDFSIPLQRYALLKEMADSKLSLVLGWDREMQPIYFQVDYDETRW